MDEQQLADKKIKHLKAEKLVVRKLYEEQAKLHNLPKFEDIEKFGIYYSQLRAEEDIVRSVLWRFLQVLGNILNQINAFLIPPQQSIKGIIEADHFDEEKKKELNKKFYEYEAIYEKIFLEAYIKNSKEGQIKLLKESFPKLKKAVEYLQNLKEELIKLWEEGPKDEE